MNIKDRVEMWMMDWFGWFLCGFFLLALAGVVVCIFVAATDHSEADFIAECSQHEPHYQCVAKWRAGESHTTVAPVPVVIPVGR